MAQRKRQHRKYSDEKNSAKELQGGLCISLIVLYIFITLFGGFLNICSDCLFFFYIGISVHLF